MPMAMPANAQPTAVDTNARVVPAKKKATSAKKRRGKATNKARQQVAKNPMGSMDHSQTKGMDSGDMKGMDHSQMKGMEFGDMKGMDHGQMKGMDSDPMSGMDEDAMMKSMQGGKAPADARDPHAYSDGLVMGPMNGMDMDDREKRTHVLIDQLDQFNGRRSRGQALDAQAWFGTDLDKLWLKVDGERSNKQLGATRTEALWDHAIATYWGLQTGVRHDFGEGPGRNWAALGVQGLAAYWFGVEATAYVGGGGRTALRLEGEYDVLLTQRLILQPNVKFDVYGKNDPRREIGSGLSQIEAGLRLRYEFSRKFAPYVGVVAVKKIGNTARLVRDDGGRATDVRAVVGIRLWY